MRKSESELDERRKDPEKEHSDVGRSSESAEKQVYLRTIYPLNPGIPHFVDYPGRW
jgi:hypothetical protein